MSEPSEQPEPAQTVTVPLMLSADHASIINSVLEEWPTREVVLPEERNESEGVDGE